MYIAPDVSNLFKVTVVSAANRPDAFKWTGPERYELAWLFCTRNGSWEVDGTPGGMTQLPRDRFLKAPDDPEYCSSGGGDHNLFQAVIGQDGKLMRGKGLLWWSDGFDKLGDPTYNSYVQRNTDNYGWADIPNWSHYSPSAGEHGAWCMTPYGLADVVVGLGMPDNWHQSFFGIWLAKPAGTAVPPGPVDPPVDPPVSGDLGAILTELRGLRSDLRLIYRIP